MTCVTPADILRVNERYIGPGGLLNAGMLDSAVGRPHATAGGQDLYPTPHDKAAALFHSLTCNHAFVNGNKRTAVVAAGVLLKLSGYELIISWTDMVSLATETAQGYLGVSDIAHKFDQGTVQSRQRAAG